MCHTQKQRRKHRVGLPDDFPYHDPSEEPVAEARRKQTEAHQHHQRNQEDMGVKGCTQAEIDRERMKRERLSKKATAVAEAKERWGPRGCGDGWLWVDYGRETSRDGLSCWMKRGLLFSFASFVDV